MERPLCALGSTQKNRGKDTSPFFPPTGKVLRPLETLFMTAGQSGINTMRQGHRGRLGPRIPGGSSGNDRRGACWNVGEGRLEVEKRGGGMEAEE